MEERPRVVLIEPRNPANVGFVARVLANFGLEDWTLVRGVRWQGTEAERTGAPARAVLNGVRSVETLAEAVEGCSHLLGFTARKGRHRRPVSLVEAGDLRESWGPGARVALLFGREDRGLETEEVEACTALCTIPAPGMASLNLSHAVAVGLYEWFRGEAVAEAAMEDVEEGAAALHWSSAADRMRLAGRARAELAHAGFRAEAKHLDGALRRLAALPVEMRDLRILEKIVRHARWLRERGDASPGVERGSGAEAGSADAE